MAGYLPDVDVRDLSRRTATGLGESGPARGNFTRGLIAGVDQTQGLLYGAGAAVADALGADALAERAIAGYQDNMWEAQQSAGDVMRVEDIGSLGDAGSWAAYQIGAQLPVLASIVGTGGAAGAAGQAVARKYLQKQIGTKAAALTAGGLAEREALQLAAATVTRSAARKAAAAGTTGASVGLSAGSIMGRVEEETGEMRGGTALAFGALAGTLDAVPLLRLASKIGVPAAEARRGIASKVKAAGLEALKSGGIEALTETAQTALELAAVDWVEDSGLFEQMSEEDLSELVNAAASGALLGFTMGGAAGTAATFGAQSNAAAELDEIEAEVRTRAGAAPDIDLGAGAAPAEPGAAPAAASGTDAPDAVGAPGIDLGDPDAAVERATETYERRRDQILELARERMAAGDQEAPGRMRAQLDEIQQKLQRVQRAASEAKGRAEAREGELQARAPRATETAGRGAGETIEGRAEPGFEVDGQNPVDLGTPGPGVDVGAPDPDVDVGEPARPVDGELVAGDGAAPAARRVPIGRIGEVIDGEAVEVTAGDGKAWKTERAAARALARRAPGAGYAVAPTDDGFVLRRALPAPGTTEAIDAAAHEAATSPTNDLPEPTQAQKEAGTYKMGHVKVAGLDVSIENPKGSYRRGTAPDGTPWKTKMAAHYGYVRGSEAIDGDHVDVFLGPAAADASLPVHVVDQVDPDTGTYDEPKVMVGFDSAEAARRGYLANYDAGWQGLGAITPMAMADFKRWVRSPAARKPLALPAPTKEPPDATPPVAAAAVRPAPEPAPAARAADRAALDADPTGATRRAAARPAAPVAPAPAPSARPLTPRQRAREARRVRPETDDLLLAIRKLGGIDVVEESDFRGRLRPTDDTSIFGMPGIEQTRPGRGRTLDSLTPTLFELGYLRQGTDSAELRELLSGAELGRPVYGFGVSDAQLEQDAADGRAPDDYVPYEAPDTLGEFLAATPTAEAYAASDGAGARPGYDYPPDVDSDARTLSALLDDLEGLGVPRASIEATVESMARAGDDTPTIMRELFTLAEDLTDADGRPEATERAGAGGARAQEGEDAGLLDSYDEADIAAREAGARAAAEDERAEQRRSEAQDTADDFRLTGSDLPADEAAARGQGNLLDDVSFNRPGPGARAYPLAEPTDWWGERGYADDGGRMIDMSPQQFLDEARPLAIDEESRETIDELKEHIEAGRTLDPLKLRADGKEDGRHRAHAARELGIETVPVITYRADADLSRPAVPIDADRAPRAGGVSVGEARKIVKRVARAWTGAPPIEVVESIDQVPGIAEAYRGDTQIRGVYSNRLGKVFLVAPSIPNAIEVERTLLHEVQHFAGRQAYGREARARLEALANLVRTQHGDIAGYVAARGIDYDYAWYNRSFLDAGLPQAQADAKHVDELLAIMAGDRASGGGRIRAAARAAIAELRRWLRSLGLQLTSSLPDDALVAALNETQKVLTDRPAPALRPIRSRATPAHRVWHGSPARFDNFDLAYLDSGEGSQNEGHGLYFSDKREVGEWYRHRYAGLDQARFRGKPIAKESISNPDLLASIRTIAGIQQPSETLFAERRDFEIERLVGEAELSEELGRSNPNESDRAFYRDRAVQLRRTAGELEAMRFEDVAFERQGAVYQVDLAPKEDEYLDFEAPLGQQSDHVTEALEAAGYPMRASVVEQAGEFVVQDRAGQKVDRYADREDAEAMATTLDEGEPGGATGRDLYEQLVAENGGARGESARSELMAARQAASEFLLGIGIRGNRYQGGGVDGVPDTAANNYVVFDDADAVIEATFNRAPGTRGSAPAALLDALTAASPNVSANVSETAGRLVVDRMAVPKASRGEGAGSAWLQALADYADSNAQRVSLTADGDFGGSKAGQRRLYGRFGFKPNTGRARDFEVSENMIREPRSDPDMLSRPGPPPGPAPTGPVARAVQALRDGARAATAQHAPTIKRYVRRNFSKEGLIDDGTFQEKLKADAMKNVGEMEVSMLVRDLENAVASAFRVKRYMDAPRAELERVNAALAGEDVGLPSDLQEVVTTLRAHLDTLSAKTNESVADLIEIDTARLTDEERAGVEAFVESDGEIGAAPGRLERLLRTSWAIQRNMGRYLHRSYQAFNDPDWKAKTLANRDLIRRTEAFIAERNPELSADEVTGAVRAILQAAAKTSSMVELVGGSSMLGAKDVTILKKREDVPEIIRELLGEYTDPRVNFAKSSTAMYNLVANHHFLMRVRTNGLGTFLHEKPTGTFDDQLAGEDSDTMSPLNGLYTSEDFRQGMQDHAGKPMEDGWLKNALKITSMVKYGKVILSPATQLRNVQSALGFLVANGHFDFRQLGKGFQATKADLFTKDEVWRDYLKDLIGLGVLHDNPNSGELRAVLKDFTDQDLWAPGARGGMNRFFDFMTRLYQVGDDLIKIAGFENEVASAQREGMTLEEARAQAAIRIRDGYPTYSQVPRVIRGLRRSPVVGAFTSFASETIRTTYNQVRFIAEDHRRGHIASRNRRIMGLALMSASAYAASKLSMMMMGFSDEDDEAIRDLLPPWSKNSQLLYLGQNDDGLPLYYDMSYMDPMDFVKRPIVAMLNGNNEGLDRKVLDAGKEFLMPFLGPEIAAGAAFEVLSNKKMGGGAIWNPHDATEDKGVKILNHVRKAVQPGFMANLERTWLAAEGEVSRSGRAYTLAGEGLGWLGHRVSTLDVRQALVYKAYEMADATRGASQIISQVAGSPQTQSDADIRAAFDSMRRARRLGFQKMTRLARGAEGLGVPRSQIMAAMKVARIKESDRLAVMDGRVPDWEPGARFTQSAEDRLTLSAPNRVRRAALQRELARRRRLIDRMVAEIRSRPGA